MERKADRVEVWEQHFEKSRWDLKVLREQTFTGGQVLLSCVNEQLAYWHERHATIG